MRKFLKRIYDVPSQNIILFLMGILNYMLIGYIVAIICFTQNRIIANQDAYNFIESLNIMPERPANRIVMMAGVFFILGFAIHFKHCGEEMGETWVMFINFVEVVSGIILMLTTNMVYNGIIFLVVADIIYQINEGRSRIIFIFGSATVYIFCNYQLATLIFFQFNSFDSWTAYYGSTLSKQLLAVKTVGELFNLILFVIYLVMLWMSGVKESQKMKGLNLQLQMANDQLREYALEREMMGETRERNRLAREIHDTLGHILTGISVGTDAALVLMDIDSDKAKEQMNNIGNMARSGLTDVRRSVRKLKPDILEKDGLHTAIEKMIRDITWGTDIKIYYVSEEKSLHFKEDEEEAVYRIVQESVTNAIRHGKATEIWIHLTMKDESLSLMIKDNGCGCDKIVEGFGLKHIRERVELLNGEIMFESMGGFYTIAKLPIRK